MKKQNLFIKVVTSIFVIALGQLLVNYNVYGLELVGPPRSLLQESQSAFGIEAGYSQMDIEATGDVTPTITMPFQVREKYFTKYKINNLKSTTFSARLDTNVLENWDVFVRLGAANASNEIKEVHSDGSISREYDDFEGNYGFSWGVGTRTTFYKYNNVTWGGTLQVNWNNPGQSNVTDSNDINFSGKAKIKYWEVQLAIGPTIEYDNIRIYGGPFLHLLDGNIDISGNSLSHDILPLPLNESASHDIKEKSQIGGFLGAQWKLGNKSSLVTEAQITHDGWGASIGTTWKF